jgi:hypothetical protein
MGFFFKRKKVTAEAIVDIQAKINGMADCIEVMNAKMDVVLTKEACGQNCATCTNKDCPKRTTSA